MPLGPGKYDYLLTESLKNAKAKQGILVIFDGEKGPSFCCHLDKYKASIVPDLLRGIATQIENDLKNRQKK